MIINGNRNDQYLSIETKTGEIFGSINSSNTFLTHQNEIENKFRLTTSINFDLKKRFEYEIYYRLQSRTNNLDNSSIYIIGSTLSYNIK